MRDDLQPFQPARVAGFTLPEVLITTTLFLIVLFGVYTVYDMGQRTYTTGSQQWDAQSQARLAMERMAREVRIAGYARSDKVTDPVVIATSDTISIHYKEVDSSGLEMVPPDRYVTYSLRDCSGNVGATLYRNVSTNATLSANTFCGGDPIIDNVVSLVFTYYELSNVSIPYPLTATYQLDGQGPVTGSGSPSAPAAGGQRNLVRQVKIRLEVQEQRGGITAVYTSTTDVALRNLIP